MTIEAKIVCDSVGPNGVRISTFVLKYPRFIHSEFMTHRDFSRNASSSRAIPVKKQIEMVMEDPAIPIAFTKNQKGMQGGDALDGEASKLAKDTWMAACFHACDKAKMLADLEVHKQYANRILEPFSHITVVVTSTRWSNFFALRHHSAAQPEIAELARQMWTAYQESRPAEIPSGFWHLPFVPVPVDRSSNIDWEPLIKMSVARCARVSYLNHEGKIPTQEEDFKLYDRLLGNQPIHASPAEHQAQALPREEFVMDLVAGVKRKYLTNNKASGNFNGWTQYRKTLEGEYIKEFKEPLG